MNLLLALVLFAHAESWKWNQTLSPHFSVQHESSWAPKGFVISLEKMHNRLRMDLSMFSPWMAKERLNLYLYATQKTYLGGEFEPPSWSNGLSIMERKAVAVYERPSIRDLMETISHETTHLLFQGFWQESGKVAPWWINEGLAMMEEVESTAQPEKSVRFQNMAYWPKEKILPLAEFLATNPTEDLKNNEGKAQDWYTQAFSMIYFLYREHTRMQFKLFCERLRDGRELPDAMKSVYRYGSLAAFERDWRAWLSKPTHRKRVDKYLSQPPSEEGEDKFQFRPVTTFGNLQLKDAPTTFYKPSR